MSANGISNLPSKEAKQIAKLELASQDRLAVGNPRSFYDITQLPSRYIGDQTVDNPNPDGLILGRPWIVQQPVENWYLQFDGVDDWIRMANFTMPTSGIFSYSVKVEVLSPQIDSGSYIQFGGYSRFLITYRADQNQILLNPLIFGGASSFITVPVDISGIITSRFDIDFDLNEIKFYVNDVLVYTNSEYDWVLAFSGRTSTQNDFGNFFNNRYLICNLYEVNVNNELLYKNDESNQLTYFPEILKSSILPDDYWYLKWSPDSGNQATNNELAQIKGITGTLASLSYTLALDVGVNTRPRYLFDVRRRIDSTDSGAGVGYIVQFGSIVDSSGTSNHTINGSPVSAISLFSALKDDVCSFDVGSVPSFGCIAFGCRYNEIESFYDLAVKDITIIDDAGTHILDMSTSDGTGSQVVSDTGSIVMDLKRFPTDDDSKWVYYPEFIYVDYAAMLYNFALPDAWNGYDALPDDNYYLKWEPSISYFGNNQGVVVSGISLGSDVTFKIKIKQPLLENGYQGLSAYLYDARLSGGSSLLFASGATTFFTLDLFDFTLNNSPVSANQMLTLSSADDLIGFTSSAANCGSSVMLGARFNLVESFYDLSMVYVEITDSAGIHTLDFNRSSGTTFTSDTGALTATLRNFTTEAWVFYGAPSAGVDAQ